MSEVVARYTKDPDEQLDYGIDYSDLLASGEGIVTSTWEAAPFGVNVVATTFQAPYAVIFTSGGITGVSYTLENRITTDSTPPRVLERSIVLTIR